MKQIFFASALALTAALPAQAEFRYGDEEKQGYVESNLLSVFYHELGHALIDIQGLPIFGQEEDAAVRQGRYPAKRLLRSAEDGRRVGRQSSREDCISPQPTRDFFLSNNLNLRD